MDLSYTCFLLNKDNLIVIKKDRFVQNYALIYEVTSVVYSIIIIGF